MQESSKLAVKVANTVFVLGIMFSVLAVIYAVYKIFDPLNNSVTLTFYYACIIAGAIIAVLSGLGLRKLHDKLKVNLSVTIIITCIMAYAFETYLEFSKQENKIKSKRQIIVEQMGVSFDTRTKIEVLESHHDPLSLFPFSFEGHYSVEGNSIVAEAIRKRLEAEDTFPSSVSNN